MQRFVPVLAVLVLLGVIAALYGPLWWRNYTFQRDVEAMLAAARAGNTAGISAAVTPAQRTDVASLLAQYLPPDYAKKLTRLSLTSSEEKDKTTRICIVTAKMEDGGNTAVYQGKLLWHWNGQHWEWDFFASYAAPLSLSGEPEWQKIDDIIPQAKGL